MTTIPNHWTFYGFARHATQLGMKRSGVLSEQRLLNLAGAATLRPLF